MKSNLKFVLGAVLFPVLFGAAFAGVLLYFGIAPARPADFERIRETASALEARGLYAEAIAELDKLRADPSLTREDEADLLYKMAKIADEKLEDCARALPLYTMATSLNDKASWSSDADKRAMVCMEKSGRKQQAQAMLKQLTDPGAPVTGTVVAVVDGRSVTWEEVLNARAIRADNPTIQTPEARKQMVMDYVMIRMLADDAIKEGMENDPLVKQAVEYGKLAALARSYLTIKYGQGPDQPTASVLVTKLALEHQFRIFDGNIPAP